MNFFMVGYYVFQVTRSVSEGQSKRLPRSHVGLRFAAKATLAQLQNSRFALTMGRQSGAVQLIWILRDQLQQQALRIAVARSLFQRHQYMSFRQRFITAAVMRHGDSIMDTGWVHGIHLQHGRQRRRQFVVTIQPFGRCRQQLVTAWQEWIRCRTL